MEQAGDLVRTAVDNEPCVVPGEIWQRDRGRDTGQSLPPFHEADPLRQGMNREELRKACAGALAAELFERILEREEREGRVAVSGSAVRLAGHRITFTEEEAGLRGRIEAELGKGKLEEIPDAAGLAPRLGADPGQVERILRALQSLGVVVHLEGSLVLHEARLEAVREELRSYLEGSGEIAVSQFRELIGSNRRWALALLNHFDGEGFTIRRGDVRALR